MNINNTKDLLFYLLLFFLSGFFKMYIMFWTVSKEQDFNILLMFFVDFNFLVAALNNLQ